VGDGHERGIGIGEEEVEVGRAAGGELQRPAIEERHDEVDAARRGLREERVEDRRHSHGWQGEGRVHGVPTGRRDRERQRRRRGDAPHRRELDRELALQQRRQPGRHRR